MRDYLLIIIGLVGPFFMIKYRAQIGDAVGEAAWMKKVGGVHNVIIIAALLIFFWTIAEMTGTTSILFSPIKSILPGLREEAAPAF
ncbi:hypothetical protein HYW84_03145 [Candidatus Peregrinibacteria bacterium]|nr:hypothetical protein [Candidatus Peregrinibacteria bacterium]